MSLSGIDNSTSRGVSNDVQQSGFRPQLFLVAAGSYASNPAYGPGAVATGTYDAQTPPITDRDNGQSICQTRARMRQQDNNISFDITICLDATQPNPFGLLDTDEVRIRVLPLSAGEPGRYNNPLKTQDPFYGLPLFLDIEVVNQLGVNLLPAVANTVLQARYLSGGQLALVQQDISVAPPVSTALVADDIGALLSILNPPGSLIRIHVRGQYKGTHN